MTNDQRSLSSLIHLERFYVHCGIFGFSAFGAMSQELSRLSPWDYRSEFNPNTLSFAFEPDKGDIKFLAFSLPVAWKKLESCTSPHCEFPSLSLLNVWLEEHMAPHLTSCDEGNEMILPDVGCKVGF